MPSFTTLSRAGLLAAVLAAGGQSLQASSLKAYLSAPFSQTPGSNGTSTTGGFTNAATEDFTNANGTNSGGTSPTGNFFTYNSPLLSRNTDTSATATPTAKYATPTSGTAFSVLANGQFGGGGQGNYLGVNPNGPTTLTFSAPVGYFGLEWCAVDNNNSMTLFDQNGLSIGTFNAATFANLTPNTAGSTVTAVNGTKYNSTDYYGQPTGTTTTTPRQNANEEYAFLNFIADAGTKISKVTLTQSTGAIFESDNHAILTTAPTVNSSSPLVFVSAVPEPSTVTFFAAAAGLMMVTIGRRYRRN